MHPHPGNLVVSVLTGRLMVLVILLTSATPVSTTWIATQIGILTPPGHYHHRHIHIVPDTINSIETSLKDDLFNTIGTTNDLYQTSGEVPNIGMGHGALMPFSILPAAVFQLLETLQQTEALATHSLLRPSHPPPRT